MAEVLLHGTKRVTFTPVDRCLEWCTLLGQGSREQFARATAHLLPGVSDRVLSALELAGHLEVDWERTGRWSVNPPVLALPEGSGGNAFLVGGRNEGTVTRLLSLRQAGHLAGLTVVRGGETQASTWFVGIHTVDHLYAVAHEIGAAVTIEPAQLLMQRFPSLDFVLARCETTYVPSGFGAKRLDVVSLRYEPIDVKYGNWPAGCFEQLSRGRRKYVFVDDEDRRFVCDRWVATHAELRRQRQLGQQVPQVLAWDMVRERMAVSSAAQLPTPWARAAALTSGLSPRRVRKDGLWDVFEGVPLHMYKRFAQALGLSPRDSDLGHLDEDRT